MQQIFLQNYIVSDDKNLLQIDKVHGLLKEAYWCKGIAKSTFQLAIDGSLCFGVYGDKDQVAFARVVTDGATFAWLCDVIVDEKLRSKGIAKNLMKFIMIHPRLQGLRRFCLVTSTAHQLYQKYKFKVIETPQNWMEIRDSEIYLREGSI